MWTDKLAFIGAGNIAEVLIDRLTSIGSLTPSHIFATDISATRRSRLRQRFEGLLTSEDNREAPRFAKCVIIATPPHAVIPVVKEIHSLLSPDHVLLCLATSVSLARLEEAAGAVVAIRALINSPSMVGEGMNLVAFGHGTTPFIHQRVSALLDLFGLQFEVSDEQMDFWCAICSSGPNYIFPVIDTLMKAAMARGISHEQALIGASQVVLGAARLVQQTGKDPQELERLTNLHTLREDEAHRLFTEAYEEALARLKEATLPVGA